MRGRGAWTAAVVLVAAVAGCTTGAPPPPTAAGSTAPPAGAGAVPLPGPGESMRPLHGVALPPTGLRVLIGADHPVLLDLDRGTRRPVTGLPAGKDRLVWLQAVGGDAVLGSTCASCGPTATIFAVRRGATAATRIGTGWQFAPTRDGRGIWLMRQLTGDRCTLVGIGLDGRILRPGRPIDCHLTPRAETAQGLLLEPELPGSDSPATGAVLRTADGRQHALEPARIYAVAGDRVLGGGWPAGRDPFQLTDLPTGTRRQVAQPATVGGASDGLVSPDGRYVAMSFEHPAWPGPRQRMDVWLLDLTTLRWQHLPTMPVPAALKSTDLAWAPDGRLVLLGEFDGVGRAVAVWRPGQAQLAVRRLPGSTPGGPFAVW